MGVGESPQPVSHSVGSQQQGRRLQLTSVLLFLASCSALHFRNSSILGGPFFGCLEFHLFALPPLSRAMDFGFEFILPRVGCFQEVGALILALWSD